MAGRWRVRVRLWAIRHRLSCTLARLLLPSLVCLSVDRGWGRGEIGERAHPGLEGERGTRTPVTKVRPVGTGGTKVIVVVAVVVVGQW